jgi:adenylate cyclase
MREVPLILVVDDVRDNIEIVRLRLESQSFKVITAERGEEALEKAASSLPDLILLDVMMPGIDGIETVKRLKANKSLPFIPVILLTAKSETKEVIAGLDSGADDYLTKPFDHGALMARVRAMLRIKALHDTVQAQSSQLAEQASTLAGWNQALEARVATQITELERIGRLKRFLSPQITDLIVSEGRDHLLQSHRSEVVVLFCDLRGFTAFSETSEPEEVMVALREYHLAIGPLVHRFDGTVGHFAGDGLMVLFNDPVACADPVARACGLAMAIREALLVIMSSWQARGFELGFGMGIAQGYATIGLIGFEQRMDYAAIGTVVNLASRLCSEAINGEILVTKRVAVAMAPTVNAERMGEVALKGLARPTETYRIPRSD